MNLLNPILTFTQIALETLPISSTAHILIVKKFFNNFLSDKGLFPEYFFKLCNIPTLFVLVFYFRKELKTDFSIILSKNSMSKAKTQKILELLFYAATSCFVTGLIYVFLKEKFLKKAFIEPTPQLLILSMSTSALILFSIKFIKNVHPNKILKFPNINIFSAVIIGIAQSVSLIPGISRFVSTYTTCRWLGNNGPQSIRYSFLLHAILSIALAIKALFVDLFEMKMTIDVKSTLAIFLTSIFAMVISIYFLKLSDNLSNKNNLWKFAFYYPIPILLIILLAKFKI